MRQSQTAAWVALIVLLFLPAVLLTAFYLYDGEAFVSDVVERSITTQEALDERAAAVWWALSKASFIAILAAPAAAAIWVRRAENTRAVDDAGGRSRGRSWWLALALLIPLGLIIGNWWLASDNAVAPDDPAVLPRVIAAVAAALALAGAYWLATALWIRPAMRASVPAALRAFKD